MKLSFIALIWFLFAPLSSFAHGPTPQKAKESVVINASVDKVWGQVKQFDEIANWHPDVKFSTGENKYESGGSRTLTFTNGEQLQDELDYYSDKEHEYSYRLKTENVKALPVSSYSVELQVKPGDAANTAVVTLKSRFYRGDTGNTPPENLNDAAAVTAINAYFKNGLAALKERLEK